MTEKDEAKPYEEKPDFNKSGDDKQKDRKSRKEKTKPLTKVIIRRLPPSMTEEDLLKQIDPIPDYDYFYFVPADYSLGENASSRAYINFIQQDDIFLFKEKFDGYVFVDTKGAEYPAVVEFAPFQGLPKMKSRKKDNKCGTIESDQHYVSFLASLTADENETSKPEAKMEYCYQIKDDKKITSTPLLEFIASKKQARREERRKKIEEKKKQREDEKIRKQNQVAKGIPTSIQEEDDDGIIVRTIKSRPLDRDRGKKDRIFEGKSKTSDDKGRNYKDERDRKRTDRKMEREKREERQKNRDELNAKRKEDRERMRRDRDINSRDDSNRGRDRRSGKSMDDYGKTGEKGSSKEEKVKKYSESRRERFNRNEHKFDTSARNAPESADQATKDAETSQNEGGKSGDISAEKQQKDEMKSTHDTGGDSERHSSLDDGKRDSSSGDGDNAAAIKEERKRIKNKDRPSLQIYQPGKRRLATNVVSKKEDTKNGDDKIKSVPSSSSEKSSEKSAQDDSGPVKTENIEEKNQETVEPSTSTEKKSSIENKPIERKVTRYSERRNKARERRGSKTEKTDLVGVDQATDAVTEELRKASLSDDWNEMCTEDNVE